MGDIDWRDIERIEQSARWEEKLAAANAEIARLREERRWIPVAERLPELGVDVLAIGSEGVFEARLALCGDSHRWEPLILDFHGCGC